MRVHVGAAPGKALRPSPFANSPCRTCRTHDVAGARKGISLIAVERKTQPYHRLRSNPGLGTGSLLALMLLASSCHDSTGLHIAVRVGHLQFDELRIGVVRSPNAAGEVPEVLVDPETKGRFVGPFSPGDQDVYIQLADALDGVRLRCSAMALHASAVVGRGETDATVRRDELEQVAIPMDTLDSDAGRSDSSTGSDGAAGAGGVPGASDAGMGGAAGMAGATGADGGAGRGGTSGTGGAAGTGGEAGTGDATGTGGRGGSGGAGRGGTTGAAGAGGRGGATGSGGTTGAGGTTGRGGTTGAAGAGGRPAVQKLPNGQRCSSAGDCSSAHCIDGVCCESDCSGACTSCAQPGAAGLCRPAPSGKPDPRRICVDLGAATCGTSGLCDVSGHCAKYAAGSVCMPSSCKNTEMLNPAALCDGAGTCLPAEPAMKCPGSCADGRCL